MGLKYNCQQRREYINFTRKVGSDWIEVFEGNAEFYSTGYWDLLSGMWDFNKPMMVSDALRFMKSIKSPFTARKYLQKVIDQGFVIEQKNPSDERSVLVELTPEFRVKLDVFFDGVIDGLKETAEKI